MRITVCIPAINNFGKFSPTISPKAWKGMRQLLLLLSAHCWVFA